MKGNLQFRHRRRAHKDTHDHDLHKHVIGWREWVSLPQLGVPELKAKIDTGARSSAICAYDVQGFKRSGSLWSRFKVPYDQKSDTEHVVVEAPVVDHRDVRSSNGEVETRFVIRTYVELMDVCWPLDLTLTDRSQMRFRMLLGREAMEGRFIVDVEKSYMGGLPVRTKRRKKAADN